MVWLSLWIHSEAVIQRITSANPSAWLTIDVHQNCEAILIRYIVKYITEMLINKLYSWHIVLQISITQTFLFNIATHLFTLKRAPPTCVIWISMLNYNAVTGNFNVSYIIIRSFGSSRSLGARVSLRISWIMITLQVKDISFE